MFYLNLKAAAYCIHYEFSNPILNHKYMHENTFSDEVLSICVRGLQPLHSYLFNTDCSEILLCNAQTAEPIRFKSHSTSQFVDIQSASRAHSPTASTYYIKLAQITADTRKKSPLFKYS